MREITVSLDQLSRPQPGGIAVYARGLVSGLREVGQSNLHVVGLGVRHSRRAGVDVDEWRQLAAPVGVVTRVWRRYAWGVPASSDVVHATSLAGPFAGGRRATVHSVALHDVLWREQREATTARGARFHERRLRYVLSRDDVRLIVSSPPLVERLAEWGVARSRLFFAPLGVESAGTLDTAALSELRRRYGLEGSFTLYAGTREPRKNLERLARAHSLARQRGASLGPLVVVGPPGWGAVEVPGAVILGVLERSELLALYRAAAVVAYVPLAEGWGLPPIEALAHGAPVVVSSSTPSVRGNSHVELVDPLDVDSIATGLARASEADLDDDARRARRESVAHLNWRATALAHLAAWS